MLAYLTHDAERADCANEGAVSQRMTPILHVKNKVTSMLLPKEPVLYEKAACTMGDFQKMLGEFKLGGFSGYALLDYASAQDIVFFEKGTPVRVVNHSGKIESCTHLEAVRLQLEKTPAYIKVVELPWFSVDQMVRVLMCNRIFENLLTDFVNFQKLLETIEKERYTGIMELQIGNRVHFLVFKFGVPQFSVLQYSSALKRESVEELITMVEKKGALINFYIPRDTSLVKIFETLGSNLFAKYGELNGKRLADYMEHEISMFLEQYDDVTIIDGRFHVSRGPGDVREQEQIFKEILHRQIELFKDSVGRRTIDHIYNHLLESVEKDVREIFREVIL